MSVGDKNAYYCDSCHGYIVTIDRDEGVTPMFLACRVGGFEPGSIEKAHLDGGCTGQMRSMMYPAEPWPPRDDRGNAIPTEPTWEWVAPSRSEIKRERRLYGRSPSHQAALNLRKIEESQES